MGRASAPGDWARAVRPHQWLKNLLVFLPALAAHRLEMAALGPSAAAFMAFCLAASAVYLANDVADRHQDRAHPRKRYRPVAAGRIAPRAALRGAAILALASLAIGAATGPGLALAMLAYLAAASVYALALRRVPVADIACLGGLYALRVAAGGLAAGIALSGWLVAFALFFFFALAALKRLGELARDRSERRGAAGGRGYRAEDASVVGALALGSGSVSVLVLALWAASAETAARWGTSDALWALAPLALVWLGRVALVANRGEMEDDPLIFAMRDPFGLVIAVLAGGALVAAASGPW